MKFLCAPLLLTLATAVAVPAVEEKIDYTGFKVVRVSDFAGFESEIETLATHVLNPGAPELDVVLAPEDVAALESLVGKSTVVNEDLGASFAAEGEPAPYAVPDASWFTAYHSYADHLQFLRDLQGSFTSNSEIITSGQSVQGRPITGIHLWGAGGKGSRPAVLFHSTVHAREWITTMSTEYIAYQLVTRYGSDTTVKALLDKFDFYIMTIVNPDGFLYTQTNDRLWRKNRGTNSGSSCVGTDNNRNWPRQWGGSGASSNPCSETYRGASAGNTPEIRGLVSQVQALKASRGISLYIDFHSYGQYILWAYGYSCSARAENNAQLQSLAQAAQAAIRAPYGTSYTIGPSCQTLYQTSGSSVDYVDIDGNSTAAYTYELRPQNQQGGGFELPASQIQPTVIETYAGVVAMLQRL